MANTNRIKLSLILIALQVEYGFGPSKTNFSCILLPGRLNLIHFVHIFQ